MASSSRPKVVHVVVAGAIGGAEHLLVDLAGRPELSGADHCLALMTPNPRLRALFRDAGLRVRDRGPVHENPLAYLWRSYGPADLAWLGRVIEEERADMIHAHTFGSHVLAVRAGLQRKLPVLRTEHGVRHYRDPSCALFRHWALRHTDRVVAVSGFVARTVAAVAPRAREKIEVILNGIDLSRFTPMPPPAQGPFTIAAVCRVVPFKRLHVAVEALAQTEGIRLDIAGEGCQRGRLERLVHSLRLEGRVRFLGHMSDPRPVVAAAHAVVNCTREEPLGLSVIEGAAMQRPAIAFAAGGIPEIVEDGRSGWLAREDSSDCLAAAMREAAASPERAAAFGVRARTVVESKFGIEDMCRRYAVVYGELVQGRAARPCSTM